jgi:hypothetical protein
MSRVPKVRKFDLGSEDPAVLVECKSHTWTAGEKSPSAKMTVWTESMYYIHLAPEKYRKILFVLRSVQRDVNLAAHYLKNHLHLVPPNVEFWEYDADAGEGIRLL